MNPISGSLNRKGYALWMIVATIGMPIILFLLPENDNGIGMAALFVVVFYLIFTTMLIYRRTINAGINPLLVLLILVPFVGFAYQIALLFIPPKKLR